MNIENDIKFERIRNILMKQLKQNKLILKKQEELYESMLKKQQKILMILLEEISKTTNMETENSDRKGSLANT